MVRRGLDRREDTNNNGYVCSFAPSLGVLKAYSNGDWLDEILYLSSGSATILKPAPPTYQSSGPNLLGFVTDEILHPPSSL